MISTFICFYKKHFFVLCWFILPILILISGCTQNQKVDKEDSRIHKLGQILNFCLKNKAQDLMIFKTFIVTSRGYDSRNQRYFAYISEYDKDSLLVFPNVVMSPNAVSRLLNQDEITINDRYKLWQKRSIEYWGKRENICCKDSINFYLTDYLCKRTNKYYQLGILNIVGRNNLIKIDIVEGGSVYLFPNGIEAINKDEDEVKIDLDNCIKIGDFYFQK